MQSVSIVGIGQIPVCWGSDRSLSDMAVESLRLALLDADVRRVQALYVGATQVGRLERQENLAALVAQEAGLPGIEALAVDAGCGSGGVALHVGVMSVAAGVCDVVAVSGVGKMLTQALATATAGLAAGASDESGLGLTLAGFHALIMRRYMYEFSWRRDDFANFAIDARRNAANNPNAMLRQPLTKEQYQQARVVADPLTLLDMAPPGDGAATVILARSDIADRFPTKAVRITASTIATDTAALHDRADVLFPEGAHRSARAAYAQAGRTAQDIGLFEPHDAYTIGAALSLEAAGFAEKGEGIRLALDGAITLRGRIPICTMGGLAAGGHAPGASGVYQAIAVALQLRDQAGANQVDGAHIGMAQSIGGGGACVATHIFEV